MASIDPLTATALTRGSTALAMELPGQSVRAGVCTLRQSRIHLALPGRPVMSWEQMWFAYRCLSSRLTLSTFVTGCTQRGGTEPEGHSVVSMAPARAVAVLEAICQPATKLVEALRDEAACHSSDAMPCAAGGPWACVVSAAWAYLVLWPPPGAVLPRRRTLAEAPGHAVMETRHSGRPGHSPPTRLLEEGFRGRQKLVSLGRAFALSSCVRCTSGRLCFMQASTYVPAAPSI